MLEWEESHHKQFKAEIEQCIRVAAEEGRFACEWEYRIDNRPGFWSLMEKIEKEFPGFDFAEGPYDGDNGIPGNSEGYGSEPATEWWNHYVISWEEA